MFNGFPDKRIPCSQRASYLYQLTLTLAFCVCGLVYPSAGEAKTDILNSVVKISTVKSTSVDGTSWGWVLSQASGTGFVVEGNKILTNYHVVRNKAVIRVQVNGTSKWFSATVSNLSEYSDLALLTADEEFFKNVPALQFGDMPDLQDKVTVYGYPEGGESLSITEGIVSRIERIKYPGRIKKLSSVQIDAAINGGNSGGPVVSKGKVVGVATAKSDLENTGYIIPTPIIEQFLKDISDGNFNGIPNLGFFYQGTENPSLKKSFGLEENQGGILVNYVVPGSPIDSVLKEKDIILEIDGKKISENGYVDIGKGKQGEIEYLIEKHQVEDPVNVRYLRQGKEFEGTITLSIVERSLAPIAHSDFGRYYIYGGLLFRPLTLDYLKMQGDEDDWFCNTDSQLMSYTVTPPESVNQEIVVLVSVFPS